MKKEEELFAQLVQQHKSTMHLKVSTPGLWSYL